MADDQTLSQINRLAEEEHELREREGHGDLDDAGHRRLTEVEELLDQCWDLLRQRRAAREAGRDPDEAQARSIDTVEHYEQ